MAVQFGNHTMKKLNVWGHVSLHPFGDRLRVLHHAPGGDCQQCHMAQKFRKWTKRPGPMWWSSKKYHVYTVPVLFSCRRRRFWGSPVWVWASITMHHLLRSSWTKSLAPWLDWMSMRHVLHSRCRWPSLHSSETRLRDRNHRCMYWWRLKKLQSWMRELGIPRYIMIYHISRLSRSTEPWWCQIQFKGWPVLNRWFRTFPITAIYLGLCGSSPLMCGRIYRWLRLEPTVGGFFYIFVMPRGKFIPLELLTGLWSPKPSMLEFWAPEAPGSTAIGLFSIKKTRHGDVQSASGTPRQEGARVDGQVCCRLHQACWKMVASTSQVWMRSALASGCLYFILLFNQGLES